MPHSGEYGKDYKSRPGHMNPNDKKPMKKTMGKMSKSLKGKMMMARSESGHTGY